MYTCGSCKSTYTLNTCYTGMVEINGEHKLEQSVSIRAVPEWIFIYINENLKNKEKIIKNTINKLIFINNHEYAN